MKLIEEWKSAWRYFSVQANGLGVSIIGAYTALPDKFQDVIPSKAVITAAGICFTLALIGRVVKQKDKAAP